MNAVLSSGRTALRAGSVRGVQHIGETREDGLTPVTAAITVSPSTKLTRVLYVPEADVPLFVPRAPFVWALVGGEAHVAAVGRDAAEMLGMVAA